MRFKMKAIPIVALTMLSTLGSAWAEYPDSTITLLVNFTAGGATDSVARMFQPDFEKAIGKTVVVKNIGGASGTTGTAALASAKPDGYTIGYFPLGATTVQMHMRELPYKKEDLVPVCRTVNQPVVVFTSKSSPWNRLEDFVKAAKSEPGKFAYGSSGVGTTPHLAMAALSQAYGIDVKHVPASGSAAAIKDLAGGVIHIHADPPVLLERYDLKGLAALTDKRIPGYDTLPTLKELGHNLRFSIWQGLFVPRGTPQNVIQKIEAACQKACSAEKFQELGKKTQSFIDFLNTKDFEAFYADEYKTAGVVLEQAGLLKKK